MMKVFITGANGMVGKNLVERLASDQDIELLTPGRNELNLLDRQAVAVYMDYNKPDVVFHIRAPSEGHEGSIMKLTAYLYCNLHGVWKYEKEVKIE